MANTSGKTKTTRRPDCVTGQRCGNTVLTVSGYLKPTAYDSDFNCWLIFLIRNLTMALLFLKACSAIIRA